MDIDDVIIDELSGNLDKLHALLQIIDYNKDIENPRIITFPYNVNNITFTFKVSGKNESLSIPEKHIRRMIKYVEKDVEILDYLNHLMSNTKDELKITEEDKLE